MKREPPSPAPRSGRFPLQSDRVSPTCMRFKASTLDLRTL
uniref:Uncharacterized protein n=1 Tax=Rhizophora mucronata TaxID=61149 RepID=A0A2P2IJM5_RHIMU